MTTETFKLICTVKFRYRKKLFVAFFFRNVLLLSSVKYAHLSFRHFLHYLLPFSMLSTNTPSSIIELITPGIHFTFQLQIQNLLIEHTVQQGNLL
jgi:hypothetical protein